MKRTSSSLMLIAGLMLAVACTRRVPAGGVRVQVSDDLSKVTIEAREAPLSAILAELRNTQKIDVRLNQAIDPMVTVSLHNQSLDAALAQIVPSGTRYFVRTGSREWNPGLKSGAKAGAAVTSVAGAPIKAAQRPPVLPPAGATVKRAVDDIQPRPLPTGIRYKGAAAEMVQVPRGTGPKQPGTGGSAPAQTGRTLRLRFTITDNGVLRLDSAVVIDGTPPPEKRVEGPFLYAVRRANGSMLDFGTFGDPLVEHSYRQEDQRHDERRAREGSFALSIPDVTREVAQTLNVQIYDARNVPLPAVLDQRTFDDSSRRATALRAVTGQEIARVMQGRR
jgi:hypothetical protein